MCESVQIEGVGQGELRASPSARRPLPGADAKGGIPQKPGRKVRWRLSRRFCKAAHRRFPTAMTKSSPPQRARSARGAASESLASTTASVQKDIVSDSSRKPCRLSRAASRGAQVSVSCPEGETVQAQRKPTEVASRGRRRTSFLATRHRSPFSCFVWLSSEQRFRCSVPTLTSDLELRPCCAFNAREYNAMHEENFLSSWRREDLVERRKEESK